MIDRAEFGDASRVAFLSYCTDKTTAYLNYIQAGITNGIGSQIRWMSPIGEKNFNNQGCGTYELEKEDFRVVSMEIGYITINSERDQGVIWTRFILRNIINNGPSDTDVTITLGKVEAFMLKRTFRFS